jgi:hypothetical protein
LGYPNPLSAQGRFDTAETARRVLLALYPELTERPYTLRLVTNETPLNDSWTVPLHFSLQVHPPDDGGATADPPPVLLEAEYQFSKESGRLLEVFIKGQLSHSSELERIAQSVDDHPEWSDRRILAELTVKGARTLVGASPSADFAIATATALEPFLGSITVKSVQFKTRIKELAGDPALLQWGLILETVPKDITPSTYGLVFEPFEGKLLWLHSVDLPLPHR